MPWFAPFLFVSGVAATTAGLVWDKRRKAKLLAEWRQLARELNGTFVEPGGFWKPTPAGIIANLGFARVCVDTKTESYGNSSQTFMQARVGFPLGAAPEFGMHKDGLLSTLGSKLGMRDVEVGGSSAFDDHFAIRSRHSSAQLAELWTPKAKAWMLEHFPRGKIDCDGQVLTFKEIGVYRDLDRVRRLFELLGELGNAEIYGRAVLREVAGGTYRETEGPWDNRSRPYVSLDLPSRVIVGPELGDGGVMTVARLSQDVKLPAMEVVIGPDGASGDTSALPQSAKPYLQRVGRSGRLTLVVLAGKAAVSWDGLASDPEQIHEVAQLLATLVPAGVGVYR